MMKLFFSLLTISLLCSACLPSTHLGHKHTSRTAFSIAFGSCSHQKKEQPILDLVVERKPNAFIYLGDNIYGDTRDMKALELKYAQLGKKPEFQRLKANTTVLATWDDHDYGENDAGRYYPFKEASKAIFLNFWEEPKQSERWKHEGIYHAVILDNSPIKIQVILLDTRSFRDNLTERPKEEKGPYKNDYKPTESPDSTFLGAAQWAWLEKQFQQKADLRIIASSNQFSHEYNGWESWTNVPHEQERMLKLIKNTQANGVVFISGDVHWGELSKYKNPHTYPIYDITSSGITQTWPNTEPNRHRIGPPVRKNNFGLIEISEEHPTLLTFKLINKRNKTIIQHQIPLSELSF